MEYRFEGLPKGMGATLSQFIRRSVYCQRKKWDLVGFRINDLHEFSTIPNSLDMVVDVMYRLRDMAFTIKPELEAILENNLQDVERKSFNLEQFSNSVVLFRNASGNGQGSEAVMTINLFVNGTSFGSEDLQEWLDIQNPVNFCRMLSDTRLRVTLYLMPVQGVMSSEEVYACMLSAGVVSSDEHSGGNINYMSGSNRGDFSINTLYEEGVDSETLIVGITPDNSATREAVTKAVVMSVQHILGVLETLKKSTVQ